MHSILSITSVSRVQAQVSVRRRLSFMLLDLLIIDLRERLMWLLTCGMAVLSPRLLRLRLCRQTLSEQLQLRGVDLRQTDALSLQLQTTLLLQTHTDMNTETKIHQRLSTKTGLKLMQNHIKSKVSYKISLLFKDKGSESWWKMIWKIRKLCHETAKNTCGSYYWLQNQN